MFSEIAIPLSFRIIIRGSLLSAALLIASKARPPVKAPSPITAIE